MRFFAIMFMIAVARLRLLCREYGITEVTTTGAGSGTTLRLSPMPLLDSQQLRLKRLYPSANYRATASAVNLPAGMPCAISAAESWLRAVIFGPSPPSS